MRGPDARSRAHGNASSAHIKNTSCMDLDIMCLCKYIILYNVCTYVYNEYYVSVHRYMFLYDALACAPQESADFRMSPE